MSSPRASTGKKVLSGLWVLGAIVGFSIALRFVNAGGRLSHDEGYSWLVATAPDGGAFLERLASTENTPPLFYLALRALPADSEFWLRLPALVAGVLWIPVVYAIVRTLSSRRAASVAALATAVAPFAVSYSSYSRAFMLAGLAQLVAVLAVARLVTWPDRARRRWAVAFVGAATVALYSEYSALGLHAAIAAIVLVVDRVRWRMWCVLTAIPVLLFVPWLGQARRSAELLGETKLPSEPGSLSFEALRDAVVPLAFGESGAAGSSLLRSLQLVLVLGLVGWALARLWASADRRAFWLLGGTLIGVAGAHAAATALLGDLFRQRYLTVLIPLAAAAAGIVIARSRRATAVVLAGLVVLGGAIAVHRAGREYEPDHPGAVAAARGGGATTIFTNSAVVAFYGREVDVRLDRPFGLGIGDARSCAGVCAVIDDARYGGVRPGSGELLAFGPVTVRIFAVDEMAG